MRLIQTLPTIVRSRAKILLLGLPLLLAGCAYDAGYTPAYYDGDAYLYSCIDCRHRFDYRDWHHHPGWHGHGSGWHGPSGGHDGAGHGR